MSYQKGNLRITKPCTHEECEGDRECGYTGLTRWVCDSREPLYRHDDPNKPPYEKQGVYLPHSCDEWFIGGKDEITDLIEDLQEARDRL